MKKQNKIILFSVLYAAAILSYLLDFVFIMCISAACLIAFLYFKRKSVTFGYALLFIAIFLAGLINTSLHLKYDDDLVPLSGRDLTLEAKVLSIPTNNSLNKTKFYAEVASYKDEDNIDIDIKAKTLVTINDDEEKLKKIKIGDTLELTGRVKAAENAQNPSQFDYAEYLRLKNTFSMMYVSEDWKIKSNSDNTTDKLLRKLNDTRTKIINIHAQNIKSPMLEVLGGIIFGDDAVNPDDETKDKFINSGIFHILAASGMNVTLIFGIWFFLAVRLKFNYGFSIIAGMLLILFYTCMTGFGPPIIRASIMLTLILTGKLFNKTASAMPLLFLAGFLMLLYNPLMLFDIGFQLSFAVTFALILTSPAVKLNIKYKVLNNIAGACFIPVIAQIYAMPLQLYYFNTVTMYSVFANIAIIPVLSIVSFIGFISSIIAVIPFLSVKVCAAADFVLNPLLAYIVKTAEFFSALPNSIIFFKKPLIIQIVLYFAIVILLTCMFKNKLFIKKVYALLAVLTVLFGFSFIPFGQNKTEIMFFAAGNADAIMIKTDNNRYFLIDTGKKPYMSARSQAENIIIKYLKDKGIKNIHSLILTHFDADHAGGTEDILKAFNTQNVYITDCSEDTELHGDIVNYIKENNINAITVKNNTEIYKDENTVITLLRAKGSRIKSENQKSIITHFNYKNKNILFMADGDTETYNALNDTYKQNLFLIKTGHHGAENTVNEEMANNAEFFVILTGTNIYGHPSQSTLDALNGKKYYRTDYHNAIKIILDDENYKIYLYSPAYHKFIRTKPDLGKGNNVFEQNLVKTVFN